MQNTTNYPEISNATLKDTREALSLAYLNYDSLTEAGQKELLPRMNAMHARLAELGYGVPTMDECMTARGHKIPA